eukprot:scaffold27457_cov29-Tisochrysis_lutea.AAC.3
MEAGAPDAGMARACLRRVRGAMRVGGVTMERFARRRTSNRRPILPHSSTHRRRVPDAMHRRAMAS